MIRAVLFDYGRVIYGPLLPHPKIRKLAKELRKNGIRTGVLSNIFWAAAWSVRLTGGYRGFDPVILSYKVKSSKPESKVYGVAIKQLGLKPSEIIFIDNLSINIDAADKLGMKTVLAKNSDQVVADVAAVVKQENGLQL